MDFMLCILRSECSRHALARRFSSHAWARVHSASDYRAPLRTTPVSLRRRPLKLERPCACVLSGSRVRGGASGVEAVPALTSCTLSIPLGSHCLAALACVTGRTMAPKRLSSAVSCSERLGLSRRGGPTRIGVFYARGGRVRRATSVVVRREEIADPLWWCGEFHGSISSAIFPVRTGETKRRPPSEVVAKQTAPTTSGLAVNTRFRGWWVRLDRPGHTASLTNGEQPTIRTRLLPRRSRSEARKKRRQKC